MQVSRNDLDKLSYCPLVSLGIDNEGTIFYKSKLADMLFPTVKQGTRLDRYTTVSLASSSMNKCIFCGYECTAFIQNENDCDGAYTVISLFEKSLCTNDSNLLSLDERRNALLSLMSSDLNKDKDESVKALSLLQSVKRLIYTLNEWRAFTNRYIEQCQFEINGAISLESFMYSVERVVNNRLDLGISIEYLNSNVESSVKMSVPLAVTVLNIMSYIVASKSDGKTKISVNKLEGKVSICFSYSSRLDLDGISSFSDLSPKIITLLTGVALCDEKDFNIDLVKSGSETEITLTLPHSENSSMVFSSNEIFEKSVVRFFNMLAVFFED